MANTLKDGQSNIICGLGAYTHTTAQTKMYFVKAHCDEVPPSGLTITLAQSGSTSASVTSSVPAAAQNHIEIQTTFNCVAGDIITVTIASSTAIDEQLNTVKTTVVCTSGQGQ